jgi:exopolyphosphatase / guanosine-5'-triphosphate,3'-diphosphate pyrophosphatase
MSDMFAAIDLGTNTARLLIATFDENRTVRQVLLKRRITRLGGGFTKHGGISADARERSSVALREFAADIRQLNVDRVRAVATSAVRDAVNGQAFCAQVLEATGIRLEVIDGNEEGELTLSGVLAGIDGVPEHLMVFDVGGGSTEYTFTSGTKLLYTESLPLGVVRLTEGKVSQEAMLDKIERELNSLRRSLGSQGLTPLLKGAELVGTAGTATTLAAISMGMTDYDYRRVNNYTLSLEEIRSILAMLLPLTPEQRLSIPGMEPGREDLIIAGILITVKTMETFDFSSLKVSDFGLLEGVLASVAALSV